MAAPFFLVNDLTPKTEKCDPNGTRCNYNSQSGQCTYMMFENDSSFENVFSTVALPRDGTDMVFPSNDGRGGYYFLYIKETYKPEGSRRKGK